MKTSKLKTLTTTLALITSMSFTSVVWAEDVAIPVISKPAVLQEGTQRDLTAAQIADLLPWAKDSKVFLSDLLDSLHNISSQDKVDRMVEGIKQVVGESAPKNSELLMRYSLNRALAVNDIIKKEMDSNQVGTIDAQIRVLTTSIKLAIKYYDADMLTLSQKAPIQFITYGLDYFSFLSELNKSIFDASAQYSIQRTSLEWLQWDLYRDLNNASYAPQIVKINNNLKLLPTKKVSDAQAITYIRQMKQLSESLSLTGQTRSQRSNNNSLGNILETPNFKNCYSLKYASLSSATATDQCVNLIKTTGFDFTDNQFLTCHELYFKSLSSSTAVDICMSNVTSSPSFDYTSSNFNNCYSLEYASISSAEATTRCKNSIEKTQFDYTNDSFLQCHSLYYKSLSSSTAVAKCISLMK